MLPSFDPQLIALIILDPFSGLPDNGNKVIPNKHNTSKNFILLNYDTNISYCFLYLFNINNPH